MASNKEEAAHYQVLWSIMADPELSQAAKCCIIGGLALSGNAFSAKAAIISASICADAADAGPVAACCPAFRRIAFISLSNSSSI